MTIHKDLLMHREELRISQKKLLMKILDMNSVCCIALHDEPFPYIVPMNYGYIWEEQLVFYLHMAIEGHRIELIKKNPNVGLNVSTFLDRYGYNSYQKEFHDYRSISAYGLAEIVTPVDDEDEFLFGMNILCRQTKRPWLKKVNRNMRENLFVLKIVAKEITGKAQYPILAAEDVPIPENV